MKSKVKNIKVLLIKPLENICEVVELKTEKLDEIYNLLECNLIDIPSVEIGDNIYDVYCDDEYLLNHAGTRENVAYADLRERYCIFGNIFITRHNREGENIGLRKCDIDYIMNFVAYTTIGNHRYIEN